MGSGANISIENDRINHLYCTFTEYKQLFCDVFTTIPEMQTCSNSNDLSNVMYSYPEFALFLTKIYANNQLQTCFQINIVDVKSTNNYNILDSTTVDLLHLENGDTSPVKNFMMAHKLNTLSGITAECQNIDNIDWLNEYLLNKQFMLTVLDLSTNNITSQNLINSTLIKSETLTQLSIGGNPFTYLNEITKYLPSCLLVLDLSFTDNLILTPGVFLYCPQLLSLSLDNCNIKTTIFDNNSKEEEGVVEENQVEMNENNSILLLEKDRIPHTNLEESYKTSIFYGLISLINLSLKENNIENMEELLGLNYFIIQQTIDQTINNSITTRNSSSSTNSNNDKNNDQNYQLTNLCIAENPICEYSTEMKKLVSYIDVHIPSVHSIDDKILKQSSDLNQSLNDHTSVEYRAVCEGVGGILVSDTMEREYIAALKGEQDRAVVS